MALFRENAVVVITGADGGIGKVLVAHLTKLGATVVRCDRGEPDPHNFDVRDRAGWDRMLDAVIEEHGRIDALINNAGRQAQGVDTVVDLDDDEWQAVMDVNVKGVRLGMSTTIPRFGPDGGRIINTASVAGHLASQGQRDRAVRRVPARRPDHLHGRLNAGYRRRTRGNAARIADTSGWPIRSSRT